VPAQGASAPFEDKPTPKNAISSRQPAAATDAFSFEEASAEAIGPTARKMRSKRQSHGYYFGLLLGILIVGLILVLMVGGLGAYFAVTMTRSSGSSSIAHGSGSVPPSSGAENGGRQGSVASSSISIKGSNAEVSSVGRGSSPPKSSGSIAPTVPTPVPIPPQPEFSFVNKGNGRETPLAYLPPDHNLFAGFDTARLTDIGISFERMTRLDAVDAALKAAALDSKSFDKAVFSARKTDARPNPQPAEVPPVNGAKPAGGAGSGSFAGAIGGGGALGAFGAPPGGANLGKPIGAAGGGLGAVGMPGGAVGGIGGGAAGKGGFGFGGGVLLGGPPGPGMAPGAMFGVFGGLPLHVPPLEYVQVFHAARPFDQTLVYKNLPKAKPATIASKHYFKVEGPETIFVFMPSDQLLIVSNAAEDKFKELVAADGTEQKLKPDTLKIVESLRANTFWSAVPPSDESTRLLSEQFKAIAALPVQPLPPNPFDPRTRNQPPPQAPRTTILERATGADLLIHLDGKTARAVLRLVFADAQTAASARVEASSLLDNRMKPFISSKLMMTGMLGPALTSAPKLAVNGNHVEVVVQLDKDMMSTFVTLLTGVNPAAQGFAPGNPFAPGAAQPPGVNPPNAPVVPPPLGQGSGGAKPAGSGLGQNGKPPAAPPVGGVPVAGSGQVDPTSK
jgi:hypothetical protein